MIRVDDATTSTPLLSSPGIPPTSSRHHHEQFQRLQHPSNASTASPTNQQQPNFFNSSNSRNHGRHHRCDATAALLRCCTAATPRPRRHDNVTSLPDVASILQHPWVNRPRAASVSISSQQTITPLFTTFEPRNSYVNFDEPLRPNLRADLDETFSLPPPTSRLTTVQRAPNCNYVKGLNSPSSFLPSKKRPQLQMIEWREGVDVGPSNFYTTKFKVISTNAENSISQLHR